MRSPWSLSLLQHIQADSLRLCSDDTRTNLTQKLNCEILEKLLPRCQAQRRLAQLSDDQIHQAYRKFRQRRFIRLTCRSDARYGFDTRSNIPRSISLER